jgi:hypothetical protein
MHFYSIPNTRSLDQGTKKIDNCNNNKKQPEKKDPEKKGKKALVLSNLVSDN